ncbi:MAG: Hsp20 family protein [Betaproteobacteria bacterium]|nr:Hsp20 family protein [Betaproteobacteria bacterium]
MYWSSFPRDAFAEFDRLQRELSRAVERSPSIRGFGRSSFPALNVGDTQQAVEIYAFAPGLDPASIDVQLDRGILTISGDRRADTTQTDKSTVHVNERFSGAFRRVVSLPDDADPDAVSAEYRDGVLHIAVKRRAETQPRRINVQ